MRGWEESTVDVPRGDAVLPVAVASRPGAAAPLVYLHGLGSSKRDFEAAATAPQLLDRRLIAIDLPGSGASRIPEGLDPDVADLVEVVAATLHAIDCGPVHLIGHSMGGLVALLLAAESPGSVRTLVSVEGNLHPVDCRVFSRRVAHLATLLEPAALIERLAVELAASGRLGYEAFARRFVGEVQPEAFVRYCRSIVEVSEREGLLETFASLEMPRLFVHGRANRDLPYLADLAAARVEVEEIAASDHFPLYTNPDALLTVLARFMNRHEVGHG